MQELLAVRGLEKTTDGFRRKLVRLSSELGLDPSAIAAVISFETAGSFSPSIENPSPLSDATGLIQFTGDTAKALGTNTTELSQMSATRQLDYVAAYYKGIGASRIKTTLDHYLAVFAPAFIGRPATSAVYLKGSKNYTANEKMDQDGDGIITVGDISRKFLWVVEDAQSRPPIFVEDGLEGHSGTGFFAGLSLAAWAITIYTLSRFKATAHRVTV